MPSGLPAGIFSSPSAVVTFSPGTIVTSHSSGSCWTLVEALGALAFVRENAGGGGSLHAISDDTTTRTASGRERMRAMLQSSEICDEIGARGRIELESESVTNYGGRPRSNHVVGVEARRIE